MQAGLESTNPIIPTTVETTVLLAGLVLIALLVTALVSILRSRRLTPGGTVLWILIVFAFPALGPLLWFIAGRSASDT
ncbi:PLDc N-terminal domain-containing protein [Paenarthrobacter sp. FR1]|uniref:PLDc N-terminal domain-containing protein n=1 Tax=Paenarthrobacter sp. FR1 TaxID=3439548 RepID=UPI003DA57C64